MTNTIYPCLCCDGNAKSTADFYCSVFSNASIKEENNMVIMMEIKGRQLMLLNAGPDFKKNPSISFMVFCDSEAEVNNLWEKLSDGSKDLMAIGEYPWAKRYGWLQDKFGTSWQLYFDEKADYEQKIVPTLMFTGGQNGKTEKAINFYTSIFENSNIQGIKKYDANSKGIEGNVEHAQFEIDGYTLMAMDSSNTDSFNFSEGVSLVKICKDQKEVDFFWEKLIANGGAESVCGWLKDPFGVSWQIVPTIVLKIMKEGDADRIKRMMDKVMKMKKLDTKTLEEA